MERAENPGDVLTDALGGDRFEEPSRRLLGFGTQLGVGAEQLVQTYACSSPVSASTAGVCTFLLLRRDGTAAPQFTTRRSGSSSARRAPVSAAQRSRR